MRYFFGFLVAIGLIVLVFILLLHGFGGGKKKDIPQVTLADYAGTNVQMRYTLDGPVTADQLHQGLRISVGQTESTIELYKGYQNNVVKSKSYPNNQSAYAQFLRALQLLNYNKGNKDPARTDERGFCPAGNRFIFEIVNDDGSDLQRYWATSCGSQGNYQGNVAAVRSLFRQQIPDYQDITADLVF
jgi:hypothetical protein